jgi:uncharacterized membrane protein (DUF4010 family)
VGLVVVGGLFLLDYWKRLQKGDATLLPTVIALLAFSLGPFVLTAPLVVIAARVIVILLALGQQAGIRRFSDAFPAEEGVTLAKFFVLAGLVLPLLPDGEIFGLAGITYIKVWTAVLVISGISYLGYLAHHYVFQRAGTLLMGTLGGLYSSTAATVVLARAMRATPAEAALAPAAVLIATAVMYARLLVRTRRGRWLCRSGFYLWPRSALPGSWHGACAAHRSLSIRRFRPIRWICLWLSCLPGCSWPSRR